MSLPPGARCLFDGKQIDKAVDRIAVRMAVDLWDSNPILICLMNGALPFTADLMRRFHFPVELDYIHVTRYAGKSGGKLKRERWIDRPVAGRTIVLVDDVLDAGVTLTEVERDLAEANPERILSAVLVRKSVPGVEYEPNYVALEAPNEFLIGRGMDYDGAYRHLSGIYSVD